MSLRNCKYIYDTWLFPLITSIIKSIKLEYYIVDSGAGEVATGAGGEEKRRGDGSDGQGQNDGYRSSR